jgi:hypothetical protein
MIKVREKGHENMLRRKSVTHAVHTMRPARQIVAQAPSPRPPAPELTAPQGPLPSGLSARTDGVVTITGVKK